MEIHTRLASLIKEKGITQKKIANDLHISPSTLNGYIKNGRKPDYQTLSQIALYFETTVDYLLGLSPERYRYNAPLTDDEGTFIGLYRMLSRNDKIITRKKLQIRLRHNHPQEYKKYLTK